MADLPGRPAYEPNDRADLPEDTGADAVSDSGWGSPVPAEYGSLYALQPPERTVEVPSPAVALHSAWSRVVGSRTALEDSSTGSAPSEPGTGDAFQPGTLTAVIPEVEPAAVPEAPAPARETRPDDLQADDRRPDGLRTAEPPLPESRLPESRLPGSQPGEPALAEPSLAVRPAPPGRPARRPGRSRSRVVVRHVDVAAVARVSIVFYLIVLIVIVVAAVLLWIAADVFGTLPSLDKSVRTLFSLRKFHLHVGAVALFTAAAGVVIAVIGTLGNILLAFVYNLINDVVGGVRVELESVGRDRSADRSED